VDGARDIALRDLVPDALKAARLARFMSVEYRLRARRLGSMVGKSVRVLFD
jgi:tRNA A37 methylthiotransferase MiaB